MKRRGVWRVVGLCMAFSMLSQVVCYAGSSYGPGMQPGASGSGISSVSTLTAPAVQASGAALYNVSTGKFVYEKNGATRYYPASITKLMTAMLVLESCKLDDVVTFSGTAVNNLEAGSVSLNMTEGDQLTVRQSLYALLLKSANEVANALAEHTAGSIEAFSQRMNAKAKALGCTDTNFVNPNGLNNANHYTTAHDMALIAAEAFKNPALCEIASTLNYQIPATKKAGVRTVSMGHKMLYPSDSRYYPGIVGGKTGFTSLAGNTLVTCVERDGVRLVAVVLKSSQTHYSDTKNMLDYGFNNVAALGLKTGTADGTVASWEKDGSTWYLNLPGGGRAQNQWLTVDGYQYWFEADGRMATGWHQAGNDWYFLKPNGVMARNYWKQTEGKWHYLGENGVMLKNATTPDGYYVDESGVWNS